MLYYTKKVVEFLEENRYKVIQAFDGEEVIQKSGLFSDTIRYDTAQKQ